MEDGVAVVVPENEVWLGQQVVLCSVTLEALTQETLRTPVEERSLPNTGDIEDRGEISPHLTVRGKVVEDLAG